MEPEETTVGQPIRRFPWGLLGMLGLVVAVETFVARHRLDFTDTASLSWVMSGESAGVGPGAARSSAWATAWRSMGSCPR